MDRKRTSSKNLKNKKEEHFIESTDKKLKSQIMIDKKKEKERKKLESSNHLYEQVDATVLKKTLEIDIKREPEKIENSQVIEQSEKVKLTSIKLPFGDKQKNLQNVKKVFEQIDSQFQNKLRQLHENVNKQDKKKKNFKNDQQQIKKQWLIKKSNKWNELLKEKIVREYVDMSQFLKQRQIKSKEGLVFSNIQQHTATQSLKCLNDKIERWEKKQLELIVKIHQLRNNFYTKAIYNKQQYKQILKKASETILNVFQQKRLNIKEKIRDEYVIALKYNLYRVGISYLNQEKSQLKLWTDFKKYFQDILNTEGINFLAFRLEDQSLDFQMRYMFFEASFYNFLRKCKIKCQTQTQKNHTENHIQDLTQLSIMKSHIYYYQQDIKKLEQLVEVVKKSWYIKFHLTYYIRERKQYLKHYKKENEEHEKLNNKKGKQKQEQEYEQSFSQTYQKIVKYINKAKVIFIDYSMTSVNGITLSSSQDYKQYPIFINLFSLFQKRVIDFGFFESYTFFVLIHELAHSIIRKCDFFKEGDSSNYYNTDEEKKMDGGWLFEYLIFGKAIQVFSSKDYQQVMGLLKLKYCPSYQVNKSPKNKKQYERITNDKQKLYQMKQKQLSVYQSYQRVFYKLKKSKHSEQLKQQLKNLEVFVEKNNQKTKQIEKIRRQEMKKMEPEIEKQQISNKKQVQKMIQTISSFGKRIPNQQQIISQQFMTLKTGIENLLGHQFMALDSQCGNHYK